MPPDFCTSSVHLLTRRQRGHCFPPGGAHSTSFRIIPLHRERPNFPPRNPSLDPLDTSLVHFQHGTAHLGLAWQALPFVSYHLMVSPEVSALKPYYSQVPVGLGTAIRVAPLPPPLPPTPMIVQCLLWWGSLYLIFLWIYGAATGTWRYGLNIQSARPAVAMVLLPVICFITWFIWWAVAKARELWVCGERRLAGAGRGGRREGGGVEMARADTLERAADRMPW